MLSHADRRPMWRAVPWRITSSRFASSRFATTVSSTRSSVRIAPVQALSGIDPVSHALLRIAALIAIDAAPPSYMSAVEAGLDAGASYDEIVGTLIAVMPIVGGPASRLCGSEPRAGARLRRLRGARAGRRLAQPNERSVPSVARRMRSRSAARAQNVEACSLRGAWEQGRQCRYQLDDACTERH